MATPQASHDILERVFAHWRALQLDVNALLGGFKGEVHKLAAALGIAPEIATVLVCAYVGAIVGPCWRIRTPHGYTLPVSFNIVLGTNMPFHLRGGIRALFEPLTRMILTRIRIARFEDPAALAEARKQLRARLLCVQDTIDKIGESSKPSLPVTGGRFPQDKIAELNSTFRQKDPRESREELLAELASVEFNLKPDVLLEAMEITDMLCPERLSFDASVWHLALDGESFRTLASAPSETLAQVSKLQHASWFGGPITRALQERTPQSLISNLWMADSDTVSRALKSEWAAKAGLHDTFAFIDVDMKDRADPVPDPDAHEIWERTLQFLWKHRLRGSSGKLWFSKEGASLYFDFVDEINRMHSSLRSEIKAFALHWPDLAAKLALLMHLGGHDPEPWKSPSTQKEVETEPRIPQPPMEEICAKTVNAALTLTKFIVAHHISVMERQVTADTTDTTDAADPDVEKMVRKLRSCQPATKRELYRKYDNQRCEILEPILARALAHGLIQVVAGPKFVVADVSASENRQCQCVSGGSERKSDEVSSETASPQSPLE